MRSPMNRDEIRDKPEIAGSKRAVIGFVLRIWGCGRVEIGFVSHNRWAGEAGETPAVREIGFVSHFWVVGQAGIGFVSHFWVSTGPPWLEIGFVSLK